MITSSSNQQVKSVIQLNNKGKARRERGLFVVEGIKMFLELPAKLRQAVYVSESFEKHGTLAKELSAVPYETVSDSVFRQMSDTQTPQGILCVAKQQHYTLEDLFKKERPLLMVLENLQDPGNVGTILRTGEGAGVDGVILSRNSVDIYNPKTIRSTMGSVYRVPFVYADDMIKAMETLKNHGVRTYAAHLKGKHSYEHEDYTAGSAFLIGNEGNGLSDELAEQADTYIRIPMMGQVESLNAAMASGILMYEAARQRRNILK